MGLRFQSKEQYLKLHRKPVDSMASRSRNDQSTIYVEYCRSCDTHSWCTHHDEAKYHENFLRCNIMDYAVSQMMAHRMPELEVIGNMVPTHLIPFKIAENKYIDANTNKYVVYPQIGSFEVTFRGKLVFSKKESHTWPNLPTIVSKIACIVNPDYQSPTKQEAHVEEDRETSKVSNNNSFLDSEEDKKTTNYKPQQKGFTLTDHFKMYRPRNNFEDKDWLTEKQESEASSRQISQFRMQSREKSDQKSDHSRQARKTSEIIGQTKLKEMLKHKGMITKEQGKKEMIIRLDSIEEENIFEEAAAATQRTQQKNIKKNRMKEIDDQINALDSKFKNFETRVHDIQTRNKEFQMKPGSNNGSGDEKSRIRQTTDGKRDELQRNLSIKKSRDSQAKQSKQKILFNDKTNKLEQYLNYSQQEKNDKLHRIYGEWKLIKQFNSRNKKLLRAKDKNSQQQQLDDDSESQSTSKAYSHSQSPNNFANVITFKQKNEKILQRKMKNLRKTKQHKYSSVQRYHKVSSQLTKDIKNQTDEHFYNNRKFLKPRPELQSEGDINTSQPISKLIKKSVNALSMNALKSLANSQSASNLPKIQSEVNSVDNFSTSAKANINKISSRINNIQEKLKNHNNTAFQPIQQTFHESPYSPDRQRNMSKKSQSKSGSDYDLSMKKLNKIYLGNQERHSTINTLKKNYSHDKLKSANMGELARPKTKKINEKQPIEEEQRERDDDYKPHRSGRKQAKYVEGNEDDPVTSQRSKKVSSNIRDSNVRRKVSKSKEEENIRSRQASAKGSNDAQGAKVKGLEPKKGIKQRKNQQRSIQNQHNSTSNQQPVQNLLKEKKSQQKLVQNLMSQQKKAFRERKIKDQKERKNQLQREQEEKRQAYDNQEEDNGQDQHQYEYHPHQARQAKPLERKFKDWRQSSPTKNVLKSKEIDRKVQKQGINQKIRQSDSKQTVTRGKKIKINTMDHNESIVSSNYGQEIQNKQQSVHAQEEKKVRTGQIKRNRTKPKKSGHEDSKSKPKGSKEKSQIKRGQIRNQKLNANPSQLNSQRTDGYEQAEYSENNESEQMRQETNRFSSENQYQNSQNSSKVTGANEQKLRKTLGYFKANELCYRGGVKTSEQNRSGEGKQASFYQKNNQNGEPEEEDEENRGSEQSQDHEEDQNEENNVEQSEESQFVPECKKRTENIAASKEEPDEQGWKGKSDEYGNDDEMLRQETEEVLSEKQRKNSLQQQIQKEGQLVSAQEEGIHETYKVKSQTLINQAQLNKEEVIRPQTTQEVSSSANDPSLPETKKVQSSKEKQVLPIKTPAKAKKQSTKKQKKAKSKKQAKKQQPSVDVELATCKEYSEYLMYKISNDISKVTAAPENAEKPTDPEIEVQKSNQNSQQNKQEHDKEKEIINFMAFESTSPAPLIEQQQEEVEEDQSGEEEEVKNEQNIDQKQASAQQSVGPKNNNTLIEAPRKQSEKANETIRTGKSPSIVAPIAVNPSIESLPHQPTTQNAQKIQATSPKVSAVQPSKSNSLSTSQQPLKKETQQDNVYTDAKVHVPSKYVEIGVQKQLTFEISIQTDSPHQAYDEKLIFTSAKPLQNSNEEEARSIRSQESRPQEAQSEFQGTVRNNFLNDTKSSFRPTNRSRKEVQRAKITNQILSQARDEQMQKFADVMSGHEEAHLLKESGAVTKLSAVYREGVFIGQRSLQVDHVRSKYTKLLKVLEILAERGEWILTRLFEDPNGLLQEKAFGVWLCRNFQWQCYILDDCIQVNQNGQPQSTIHTGNQKWANVLEKAVAFALGGYESLSKAEAGQIFTLLTGCNSISAKVKEDPSKNGKLLQLINDCQRKNYIVHAEKAWERSKQVDRQSIYYVLSVRRSNTDEQALLEISQDGRESFWMRLSKFTQEFSRVEVLQLRVNHNFTHIDLGIGKESQLTVIELAFSQSGQGCVTLTYIDHSAPLLAYLYREEKSRVLKLVGQAREKQKSHLFFECNFNQGRYYVFAQTKEKAARLSYYGQNHPLMRITEEIRNDGLKNEVAEYLPVREKESKVPRKEMEETWNDWKGKTPRLKDNFMESRLRENFVEYILSQNKRREADL